MYTETQLTNLKEKVRQKIKPSRFSHTLNVEKEVARMADIYLPSQKNELRAAAILHDLTKGLVDEEQIKLCVSLGIPLTDELRRVPQVLHGLSAAKIIENDYPEFATPSILNAIRVHTTGDLGMDIFSLILFVADFIEEGRPYPSCKALRETYWALVEKDHSIYPLRFAALQSIKFTLDYLSRENLLVATKTLDAMQELEKLLECEDLSCQ